MAEQIKRPNFKHALLSCGMMLILSFFCVSGGIAADSGAAANNPQPADPPEKPAAPAHAEPDPMPGTEAGPDSQLAAPQPGDGRKAADAAADMQAAPRVLNHDMAILPPEKDLTPEALETYSYLLFIRSILDEDEAALLDVAPTLRKNHVPSNIWLDGGVWLMSRKSPNSVSFLEEATKAFPDDLSLTLLYAEALGEHGMASRGVQVMRDYTRAHDNSLDARMELALLLVKDNQFDEAQKILAKITPKQRTPLVDYYQAKALIGMDKKAEAIPYLRKAIKGMPDFVEALAELAFIYEQEENLREARATYDKLQALHFSPQDVALRQVDLSLRLKQPEKAVKYIRKGPDSLSFKLTAANMLMQSRHYLQAENILKQIAAKPNAPANVYLMLAELAFEQRRSLNMAFSWLDKIPEASPEYPKACLLRIQLLAEAGKNAEALQSAKDSSARFPDSPELKDFEIRLLARAKKMDEALEQVEGAVKKWPDNAGLCFLLGSILDENGKKKEALQVMENILKKHPDNFQALNYVGFTLAEENRDLPRALELLRKADELSPEQAYIIDSLAWALFRSGQGAEALKQIRRAVSMDDAHDAAIWEHYGDIASQQGRKDEARRAYRKAIELKPSNVEEIKNRLSRL